MNEIRRAFAAGELSKAEYIAAMGRHHAVLFEYAEWLAECELAALEITAGQVLAASRDGLKFVVDPFDRRSPPIEILNFGQYEGDDGELFRSLLEPEQVVIDVGAHVGWYALHAAAQYPESQVHAFEPVPHSFAQLKRNAALNSIENVTLLCVALGDRDGDTTIFVDPTYPTAASTANLMPGDDVTTVTVPIRTLDSFDLAADVIKIDVEGGELAVLRGAKQTLERHRPAVFCEMLRKWAAKHGHHPNETIDYMASLGYVCTNHGRRIDRMSDDETATNFVFLHRERHAERLA